MVLKSKSLIGRALRRTLTVELHQDMPAHLWQSFQQQLLLDSGAFADMESVQRQFNQLDRLLSGSNAKDAAIELERLYSAMATALDNITPQSLAFAYTVKTINSKAPLSLHHTLNQLAGYNLETPEVYTLIGDLKKKLDTEHAFLRMKNKPVAAGWAALCPPPSPVISALMEQILKEDGKTEQPTSRPKCTMAFWLTPQMLEDGMDRMRIDRDIARFRGLGKVLLEGKDN